MKIIFGMFLVVMVSAEPPAPYPPSGWRPSGPSFELPNEGNRISQQQIRYIPPTNQHDNSRQTQFAQNNNNNNFATPNQQYGSPNQNYGPPPQQYGKADTRVPQGLPQYEATDFRNQDSYQNQAQQSNNQYGAPDNQNNQESRNLNNQYGTPDNQQNQQNGLSRNVNNQYGAPDNQNIDVRSRNRFGQDNNRLNNRGQDFDDGGSGDGQNQDPNSLYGPPQANTETTDTRNTPTTTSRPEFTTYDNEDGFEDEERNTTDDPNVAIAVANAGQYYILQPDGRLQRVTYKTERNGEDRKKGNGFSARLVYQDVEPIRGPIYTYNNDPLNPLGPLVQINK